MKNHPQPVVQPATDRELINGLVVLAGSCRSIYDELPGSSEALGMLRPSQAK